MGFCMHVEGVKCANCDSGQNWASIPVQITRPHPVGWECPKCGSVMSPTAAVCLYCGPKSASFDGTTP